LPRWTCRAFPVAIVIDDDARNSDHVVIVSQSLAQRTVPSVDAGTPTPTTPPSPTEATHWTAYESRLARDFGTTRFGSEDYAIEELEAELVLRSSVPTLI
jgi:hypothetical protein